MSDQWAGRLIRDFCPDCGAAFLDDPAKALATVERPTTPD